MSKGVYFKIPVKPVVLGKIGSSYGIRGWLKIFSYTENSKNIFEYQPWFIQRLGQWQLVKLESWKQHNKNSIIKIKYIDDKNAANLITNYKIIIDSSKLPPLKSNEYYWKDLIDCHVLTTKGYSLGCVKNLIKTGVNDVLVIKANIKDFFGIKERLIPFIYEKIVKNVNFTIKIIEVDWDPNF
ncbi:MAG: ribosome maturation factor RimM [Arsenophonus sp. ET-DL9-MAG3]